MKLPNKQQAIVEVSKITDYLLNDAHELGKHKATFFKAFGFEDQKASIFQEALEKHAQNQPVDKHEPSVFGDKYVLKCHIDTPDKRDPCIYTVWIVDSGQDLPRLITAYPVD